MNAAQIINDNMTLEEKLAAIDSAMNDDVVSSSNNTDGATDPADLTICFGCE